MLYVYFMTTFRIPPKVQNNFAFAVGEAFTFGEAFAFLEGLMSNKTWAFQSE